jgi:hypothetical protein
MNSKSSKFIPEEKQTLDRNVAVLLCIAAAKWLDLVGRSL